MYPEQVSNNPGHNSPTVSGRGQAKGRETFCAITERIPSVEQLETEVLIPDEGVSVKFWTQHELALAKYFLPSQYNLCVEVLGDDRIGFLSSDPLGIGLDERERAIQAIRSDLSSSIGSIDCVLLDASVEEKQLERTVQSRGVRLRSLIGEITNLGIDVGGIKAPEELAGTLEQLAELKSSLLSLLGVLPKEELFERTRKLSVGSDPITTSGRFGYLADLKELLGDNLTAVVVYGTSSYAESAADFNDYDNYVFVNNLEEAQRRVQEHGTIAFTYEGKEREVDMHIYPAELADKVSWMVTNARTRPRDWKVIHGQLEVPIEDPTELRFLSWANSLQMISNSRTMILSRFANDPEAAISQGERLHGILFEKPYRALLETTPLDRLGLKSQNMTKAESRERLSLLGYDLLPFTDNPEEYRANLLQSVVAGSELVKLLSS